MDEVKALDTEIQEKVEESKELAKTRPPLMEGPQTIWNNPTLYKMATHMATTLSKSSIVPQTYANNPSNCMLALEMAQRLGMSPLMVMQNLYIVQGKPSWSGQFCIAVTNSCGRYEPLEFVQLTDGDGALTGYYARAKRISDGVMCDGPAVTWDMVKGEGWFGKSGSKWKTMPDLMFRYRAAAFFTRTYCPELLCGLYTQEENEDIYGAEKKETTVITFD